MSKTTVDILITELVKRVGGDVTGGSQWRADALKELDRAEKYINQRFSLLSLVFPTTVTLNNGQSSVAAPATIDYGKSFAIQKASGEGELTYVPPDEWHEVGEDTYGDWESTKPSRFTFLTDGSGTMNLHFKPANSSGANITYNVVGQHVVIALIDAAVGGGSTSLLPEGWENTLLIDRAEATLRRTMKRAGWEKLVKDTADEIEVFYSSYRMTKEKATTDREQKERKVARETLAEGV